MNNQLLEVRIKKGQPSLEIAGILHRKSVGNASKEDTASTHNPDLQSNDARRRVILLVSHDGKLGDGLRSASMRAGHIIVRVELLSDALRIVRANCAHVVLLDLDTTAEIGWDIADGLMQTPKCPPVILLTGRGEQFDMRMAIQAGVVFDKNVEPSRTLQVVNKVLEAPPSALEERNAAERVLIRWLRPIHWPAQSISARRLWGLREY